MGVCSAQSASAIHSLSLRQLRALSVSALSLPSICMSIVFKRLQNPFTATLFLSHLYKTPGVWEGRTLRKFQTFNFQLSTVDFAVTRLLQKSRIIRHTVQACSFLRNHGMNVLVVLW